MVGYTSFQIIRLELELEKKWFKTAVREFLKCTVKERQEWN